MSWWWQPVAIDRATPPRALLWGSRMVEWGLLAIVILILGGIFGYYAYRVQGQAERAAIMSTLGALRTALVVDHLSRVVAPQQRGEPSASDNPFDALQRLPANYGGVVQGRSVDAIAPGNWVFDPACPCVGYKPLHLEWLESPPDVEVLWFEVRQEAAVRQLHPLAAYRWQGQSIF